MKESAQLALSWLRSRSVEVNVLAISYRLFFETLKKLADRHSRIKGEKVELVMSSLFLEGNSFLTD